MRRYGLILLLSLVLNIIFGACAPKADVTTDIGTVSQTSVKEEKMIDDLKASHPECFGIDVSEGLNVLVFENMMREYEIRLEPGNKDHYAWSEATKVTDYAALTLEEAKTILDYYGLPDDKITLRPFQDMSSYLMTVDDALFTRIANAFDNRYQVGGQFFEEYDPEIDGTYPGYPGFD